MKDKARLATNSAIKKFFDELIRFEEKPNGHLKVGPYNYYATTGSITIDGAGRCVRQGLGAFIEMIKADKEIHRHYRYRMNGCERSNVVLFRKRRAR